MRIKEKSIPPCLAGPLTYVYMENFYGKITRFPVGIY